MAQTVRRQQAVGVRRQARAQGNSRRVRKARSAGRSLIGRGLAMLPFTESQLQRAFTLLILAGAVALAWYLAGISGARDFAGAQLNQSVAAAGFRVRHVDPRNVQHADKDAIYAQVWRENRDLAMTEVDLASVRKGVRKQPWVLDASVSRQLPDVLVIEVTERVPHAVLRQGDQLLLIDAGGRALERVSAAEAERRLMIEGPGAQAQVRALAVLLDAAPALRAHVRGAEWVGYRRWNITFDSGQRLALPEGDKRAADALVSFAQADGVHRLLGGEVVAFDMRNPPRMYMRVPGRSERQSITIEEEG